jgi:hypothetical protein
MKRARIKKITVFFIALFALNCCAVRFGHAQDNTPYPIIFVHGLNSNDTTWGKNDGKFDDVLDYLTGAGLKFGGTLNICLNTVRSPTTFSSKKDEDVVLFTIPPKADFYTINFSVRANGENVRTSPGFLNRDSFSKTAVSFTVDDPSQFLAGDIIRIGEEYMKVNEVTDHVLTVDRHVLGSLATSHTVFEAGLNLSLESNQSSIAKQGRGLKLAIEAIKQANPEVKKVILVGHSMGGLAAREYIQTYSQNNVAKIVTIGTPHRGADITKLPDLSLNWLHIDGQSDAVRDLRSSFDKLHLNENGLLNLTIPGLFLFGGDETSIPDHYYSKDVDGDGNENGFIAGLNEGRGYNKYLNIARTWIVSDFKSIFSSTVHSDGLVNVLNQRPDNTTTDTLMTDRFHIDYPLLGKGEALDYYSLLRGLDEPSDPALAYEIAENSTTRGFITFGQGNPENPVDIDLFKVIVKAHSSLKIAVSAGLSTGIKVVRLLDSDQHELKTTSDIYQPITDDDLPAGTYYIQIRGIAQHGNAPSYSQASFKYPYTLTTTTIALPESALLISPGSSLPYYDVVLDTGRDKTIMLKNNGTVPLSVSDISLTEPNADQFSITDTTMFTVEPGMSRGVTVKFYPTSTGAKRALLKITSTSTDQTVKTVALTGQGVISATKALTALPDSSYTFGDLLIKNKKSKVFFFKNTGSEPLTITGLSLNGSNSDNFTFTDPPAVPFDLTPGEDRQITVLFSTATIGAKRAGLVINSDADNDVHTINIYGNGINDVYTGVSTKIVAYEYWFDDNYSAKTSASVTAQDVVELDAALSTTGLATGSHLLHLRYQDENGAWSAVSTSNFYKTTTVSRAERKIVSYEYWFDENYGAKTVVEVASSQGVLLNDSIPAISLSAGSHRLNIRYLDDAGQWSSVQSNSFFKAPVAEVVDRKIVAREYWFDDDYSSKIRVPVTAAPTTAIDSDHSTNALAMGLHTYNTRFQDSGGQWSTVSSTKFYRGKKGGANLITTYRYWFDGDSRQLTTVTLPAPVNPLVLSVNLDGKHLATGDHIVHLQFMDIYHSWSAVASDTAYFHVVQPPAITSFSPVIGSPGNTITITGANFTGATAVSFGNTRASSFKVVSPNSVTAVLGTGASGAVLVTTPDGRGSRPGFMFVRLQTISFPPVPAKTFVDPDFSPAVASSGLPVTYSSSNPAVIKVVDGRLHIVAAGTANITASQAGEKDQYAAAKGITQKITVGLAGQTIRLAAQTKTYGEADFSPATVSSRLPVMYSSANPAVIKVVNGKLHIVAAGTASITASQPGIKDQYAGAKTVVRTFTVTKSAQTIKFAATTKYFGDADFSPAIVSSGLLPVYYSSDTQIARVIGGKLHIFTAGVVTITASQAGNANYNAAKSVNQKMTILAAPQTITFAAQSKHYGDADFSPAVVSSGLPVIYKSDNTKIAAIVNGKIHIITAGTVIITASQAGKAGQYGAAKSVSQKIMIKKAVQTIALATGKRTYGDADFAPAKASSGLALSYTISDPKIAGMVKGRLHILSSGSLTVVAYQPGNVNYESATAVQLLLIGKAVLTVNADDKTKKAGMANPVLTATIKGFVNGDDKMDLITQPKLATNATASSKAGSYAITVTGASARNYTFTYVSGKLIVTASAGILRVDSMPDASLEIRTNASGLAQPVVRQAMSPNEDGVNDILIIDGIDRFPDNRLTLMDRGGAGIFQLEGYNNIEKVFNGHHSRTGALVKAGTYYYLLEYKDRSVQKRLTGFVIVKY